MHKHWPGSGSTHEYPCTPASIHCHPSCRAPKTQQLTMPATQHHTMHNKRQVHSAQRTVHACIPAWCDCRPACRFHRTQQLTTPATHPQARASSARRVQEHRQQQCRGPVHQRPARQSYPPSTQYHAGPLSAAVQPLSPTCKCRERTAWTPEFGSRAQDSMLCLGPRKAAACPLIVAGLHLPCAGSVMCTGAIHICKIGQHGMHQKPSTLRQYTCIILYSLEQKLYMPRLTVSIPVACCMRCIHTTPPVQADRRCQAAPGA